MARDKTVKSLMMGYEPLQWVTGEVITADKLNHTENGLVELYNQLTQEYTKANGTYPEMTVGYAEQLLSKMLLSDKVPYLFRTSAGGLEIGDREFPAIVGGSVRWNQLANELDSTNWSNENGVTSSFSDGVATVSSTVVNNGLRTTEAVNITADHKYLLTAKFKGSQGLTASISMSPIGTADVECNGTSFVIANKILTSDTDTTNRIYLLARLNAYTDLIIKDVMLIDLTSFIGSTIADYIYTLETSTAGSGIAKLKSWGFFTEDYYAYDAGSLVSVNGLESHDTVGFNQWDEETRNGYYHGSTGEFVADNNYLACANFIKVIPNTYYYVNVPSGVQWAVFFYDDNYNFISRTALYVTGPSRINTPANCKYFTFYLNTGYGTIYNHDICINIQWDGERNGEYEPYVKHSYPLDSTLTLRGIPKLDASYELYYDGDIYEANGTVTRRYGERAYESGDESLDDAITDGTTTVYKLETPTTEAANYYISPQTVSNWGIEEFVTTMDFPIPVGHETEYITDLKAKLESAPDNPDSDGYYLMRRYLGENSYVEHVNELPTEPTTDGSYTLKSTVTSGESVLSWEPDNP